MLEQDIERTKALSRYYTSVSLQLEKEGGSAHCAALGESYVIISVTDGTVKQLSKVYEDKLDAWKEAAEKIGE